MLVAVRLDDNLCNYVVEDDHDEDEQKYEKLKVSSEQSNDETSDENLNKVEE